jgi:hypothetical protein
VYSLVPPAARGGDGEFWGVQWSKELGQYLAPFVMQVCVVRACLCVCLCGGRGEGVEVHAGNGWMVRNNDTCRRLRVWRLWHGVVEKLFGEHATCCLLESQCGDTGVAACTSKA